MNKNNIIYIIIAILVVIIVYSLIRDRFNNPEIEFPETTNNETQVEDSENNSDDTEEVIDENENSENDQESEDIEETVDATVVNVYFSNKQAIEEGQDCTAVEAHERRVSKTEAIGTATLNELLKGTTQSEEEEGFITSIPEGTSLNALSIVNGVAVADFNEALNKDVAGSCLVQNIQAQITQTLLQFPTVNSVVISVNGDSETILQP